MTRGAWIVTACLLGLLAQAPSTRSDNARRPRFKAVAFDYLVLFNPDTVVGEVERAFPGRGREFVNLWRTRQFEYTWLRSITNRYADFSRVTEDAFAYAAAAMQLEPTAEQRQQLLDAYGHLTPWPDTARALRQLRNSGVRVIALANFTPAMLQANAASAGLLGSFDALVSTDENHTYKPDPRAYALGMQHLHDAKEEIVFAAFGGWDAAGAKAFGYPTVWVNRFNQPVERLGLQPDRMTATLDGLLEFVLPRQSER